MKLKYMAGIMILIFQIINMDILSAQDQTNEVVWTGVGLRMKVSKKFRFDVEQQLRLENNFIEYRNTFTELAANYSPWKNFRFNANYRYMHWERGIRHRYVVEGNYSIHPEQSQFFFHFRGRYQSFVWQDTKDRVNAIRLLGTVGYKLREFVRIYFKQEWFHALEEFIQFNAVRSTFGANWNLSDKTILMTYYNYQSSVNSEIKRDSHIVAFRLLHTLDFTSKK